MTPDQTLRLKCLDRALRFMPMGIATANETTAEQLVTVARTFKDFVRGADALPTATEKPEIETAP